MKKIGSRIVATVILCSVIMSLIIGVTSITKSAIVME